MLEQVDEDVPEYLVGVCLTKMVKNEEILEQKRFAPFKKQGMPSGYVTVYKRSI